MNILVTGANGQLGNHMRLVASREAYAGSGNKYVFTDINEASQEQRTVLDRLSGASVDASTGYLDITDINAVRKAVADNHIDAVINCAAFTNVDAAESNEALAEKLNADAPGILATAMKEVGGLLVHISTDYVFGKEAYNVPCSEKQTGTPTGIYGLTKLHGEQKIIGSGCNAVILRTAWLYSEFGRNFCRTMLNLTASKPSLNVVFDQTGTPTYAGDLAEAISMILADYSGEKSVTPSTSRYSKAGIYHFSNEGVCSWYDFTKMIQSIDNEYRRAAGMEQTSCDVRPCHSDEFPSPVHRPAYSVLDKTLIKETFGLNIPYWTDSLRLCIGNLI